jgi:predicted membrane protein
LAVAGKSPGERKPPYVCFDSVNQDNFIPQDGDKREVENLQLLTVITVFVAVAIPVQLSAQTSLSAHTLTTFDVPGSVGTYAESVNRTGTITGFYAGADGISHGFVRDSNGNITTFDPPGSTNTFAYSINPTGAITGSYKDANSLSHGFIRDTNGGITTFDAPGSTGTFALSINPTGAITGSYADASLKFHGFVRKSNGSITTFDPPGSMQTSPASISQGITGYYYLPAGGALGFLFRT